MRTGPDTLLTPEYIDELGVRYLSIFLVHFNRAVETIDSVAGAAAAQGISEKDALLMCLKHVVMTSVYADDFESQLEDTVDELFDKCGSVESESEEDDAPESDMSTLPAEDAAALLQTCREDALRFETWVCDNDIHERLKGFVYDLESRLTPSGAVAV